jgi:hypothetical protein
MRAGLRLSASDTGRHEGQAPGVSKRRDIEDDVDAAQEADLRLWLLDGSTEPIFPDDRSGWHFIVNKIDLPAELAKLFAEK